ncbi:MAG: tRNA1Val (adenine37-N6)-methyltransferase [Flavobacteriales bacterium]|jgi:tRNA1Val (adenine37-N6)-methyltransferase
MSHTPFQFKQFTVAHDRCAAKIGTDGVLLGAWTSLESEPDSILDIGTGTGVIALMLAQRSFAETIDAMELDDDAYEQATDNFENSDWADRLFCYHAHLYEFATEIDDQYDLIVSNPPFYESDYKSQDAARDQARFDDAMPFELLIGAVQRLLTEAGTFHVIIPYQREQEFIDIAERGNLFPTRITHVQGTPTSEIKRSLMEFCFRESTPIITPQINTLIIEKSRHDYTDDYIQLVQDFYLNM